MPSFEIDDFPALAKARLLWTSGARDAALDAFRAAIAERPRNVKALLEAARGLGARFEISEAEAFLDEAGRLAGDDPGVALQIAVSRGRFHREQRAIIELEAISDRSALIRAELTALYERANRLDDALAEIEACVRMAPSAPEPRLAHASILRRLGKGKEVVPLLKSLTRSDLSPAVRAEAWTELCHIHDGDGDAGSAAQMIAEAHAIVRSLPQMSDLMARARVNNRTIGALSLEFTSERLERWKAKEPAIDPRVSGIAHLVGFPRSGTTLLE